jgi:hypothetical protein
VKIPAKLALKEGKEQAGRKEQRGTTNRPQATRLRGHQGPDEAADHSGEEEGQQQAGESEVSYHSLMARLFHAEKGEPSRPC